MTSILPFWLQAVFSACSAPDVFEGAVWPPAGIALNADPIELFPLISLTMVALMFLGAAVAAGREHLRKLIQPMLWLGIILIVVFVVMTYRSVLKTSFNSGWPVHGANYAMMIGNFSVYMVANGLLALLVALQAIKLRRISQSTQVLLAANAVFTCMLLAGWLAIQYAERKCGG